MAEPLKATFFAFNRREQSGVLLRLSIAFVLAALVLVAIFGALFWSSLGPLVEWYGQVVQASLNNDTATIEAAGIPPNFFSVLGGILLWMFPFYILCAAFEAGCLRWLIHGEVKGVMGLSLGAPTWRVWGVYWLWLLLNIAFSLALGVVFGALTGVILVSSGGDPTAAASVQPVSTLIQYALMAYFAVRLAPAAAATIARRRFSFFQAWAVTKGRFWALFGSFAILYVLYFIASIILAGAAFAIVLGSNAPDLAAAANDPQQLTAALVQAVQSYFRSLANPQNWIAIGVLQTVSTVVALIFYIAMYGINARAAQAAIAEGKIEA
jgi:hypothetical protein